MIATLSPVQTYALRFPCPFCFADPGALCTDPNARAGKIRGAHSKVHIAREKKAGRVAIELLLAQENAPITDVTKRPGICACGCLWADHVREQQGTRVVIHCPARTGVAK